ncbi:MAG: squalene synthase HpnC [Zetaproteobacteria bacterium CG12_big_fil_rev_8_21_14_0_65_55_1124]|nr:MAG: squalene synthase HpnC [Zetaproteobacteria bacterium CG1_02_55_237]PIS20387.1 MAG: squalene synthase HpnC [Zetaproteobacteria bacterium CG08_land_8_20_14_0_20_55_17]PIW42582.1 MAG: squalene synthase HpnC [Zetaproteobacteria bacterium CG12_big_fil_rev_8_21_14_0_65_55_1124]PIY54188.1 MAG: squalene synthase HpnC [Zetaproteobacteria bacterium CG_4_10_14_0_8_um_filter_55_43]PIZ38382.1 MAG: squalene synthase HpnC [Zetaproteobacteria bacterium CG_4_10_14_0_2_um_filter_55_20]PJB81168.1 MAG: sq
MPKNPEAPPAKHVQKSYQHCMALARDHYENFPTASRLIRADLRPAVAAIYAFARTADDMADEGNEPADKRLKQLDAWETLLERCAQTEVDHPVFLALGDAIRRHDLPVACLHDLLTAFRMDVSIHAYASLDELLFYCRHSANPVGRLMLALHGVREPQALNASDAICTALQLINFWQDLSRDIPNGRCYLPDEWLADAGLSHRDLLQEETSEDLSIRLQPVLKHAVEYTSQLMRQGHVLPAFLPFRLRLQITATMRGGQAVLRKTSSIDPLHVRPKLGATAWLSIGPGALFDALLPSAPPAGAKTTTGGVSS